MAWIGWQRSHHSHPRWPGKSVVFTRVRHLINTYTRIFFTNVIKILEIYSDTLKEEIFLYLRHWQCNPNENILKNKEEMTKGFIKITVKMCITLQYLDLFKVGAYENVNTSSQELSNDMWYGDYDWFCQPAAQYPVY